MQGPHHVAQKSITTGFPDFGLNLNICIVDICLGRREYGEEPWSLRRVVSGESASQSYLKDLSLPNPRGEK